MASSNRTDSQDVDVSVIVVSWNTRDILRKCLRSIFEETHRHSLEVIVVDNASADGTVEMVRGEFPQVLVIANSENRGFAAANNQGLEIAKGRCLLLLNPDVIVLDGAIDKSVEYLSTKPEVGVFGCQVYQDEHTIQKTCFRFPSPMNMFLIQSGLHSLIPRSRFFARYFIPEWDRQSEREVPVVSGMFMLLRREAFEQVGPMDEAYFVYAEEADWCFRYWKAGWKCLFAPVARVLHLDGGGKSTSQVSVGMFVQMHKSLLIFNCKNYGVFAGFRVQLIFLVSGLLRGAAWGIARLLRVGNQPEVRMRQAMALVRFCISGVSPPR